MSDDVSNGSEIWERLIYPVATSVAELLKEPDFRSKITGLFVRRPNQHVVVIGSSGAGKTAVVRALTGSSPYVSGDVRTKEAEVFSLIADKAAFNIIDTPGHNFYKEDARNVVEKLIKSKKSDSCLGIINVVSYGYHEGRSGTEKDAMDKEKKTINETYLKEKREDEIAILRDWLKYFRTKEHRIDWLLTLVSKADLWWNPDTADQILGHYGDLNSAYVKKGIGDKEQVERLSHSVCTHSSIHRLFYNRIPMSGYYSSLQQAVDCQNTIRSIISLAEEASGRLVE